MFVRKLRNAKVLAGNVHWRPQIDFLVYERYDDYLFVEQFEHATRVLKNKIGLDIIDARPLTQHQTSGLRALEIEAPYRLSPDQLFRLRLDGGLPTPASMYSDELFDLVGELYRDDVKLFADKSRGGIDSNLGSVLTKRRQHAK